MALEGIGITQHSHIDFDTIDTDITGELNSTNGLALQDIDIYKTFRFIKDYSPTGSAVFSYHNYRPDKSDVEGLRGFSFSLDQMWIEQDKVEIGFSVVHEETIQTLLDFPPAPVSSLLLTDDPDFLIDQEYDADSGRQIITVTFSSLKEAAYIDFTFNLAAMDGMTPECVYKRRDGKVPEQTVL